MKKLAVLLLFCLSVSAALASEPVNPTLSPDGSKVAYTLDNDLWVMDVADSSRVRLTFDGSELILNGYASWVYYEEIFGRASRYRAFWWSPDSKKIAYYRFDNTEVPMFPIYSPFGQTGSLSLTRYPKAGQSNPTVKIAIVDVETPEDVVWADFDDGADQYFGTPFWSDDSSELYVQREPRRQNHLDLYAVGVTDGSKRLVYTEDYPTWLDWIDGMIFTEDGFYMARSFETGWQQIYFLGFDGSLKCLTEGRNWNVRLLKHNPKTGDLWFTAYRDSRIRPTLYRLDKKGKITALTDPEYSVASVVFSDDLKSFKATQSNARTPFQQIEGSTKKYDVKIVSDTAKLEDAERPKPQVVTIGNDGYELYALMTLPKDFDPARRYPVIMYVYGGPGTAYTRDTWGSSTDFWCYENDVIYIICDPRSSGENGRYGMDEAFGRMTVIELEDYIAWANWLKSLPYVKADRIGVTGFSFGGTTTSMLVLRYPEYFRCGIAGGGVYDWMLYDSHYTERFMDTPQANPAGYETATVLSWVPKVFSAENENKPLPGALMLTHGTGDDNVHFQNTLQLVDALQKANYRFELMVYPDGMHGYRGYQAVHDNNTAQAFWTKWLLD